jgi:hypothetical protein
MPNFFIVAQRNSIIAYPLHYFKHFQMKDIINFEESSFFILKTDEYKNWHPAMAKLDLADVVDSIFAGNGEDGF